MRLQAFNRLVECTHGGMRLPGPVLACLAFHMHLRPIAWIPNWSARPAWME
jgi:hypothetical protein